MFKSIIASVANRIRGSQQSYMDDDIFQGALCCLDEHIEWIEKHDDEGRCEFSVSRDFLMEVLRRQTMYTPFASLDRNIVWYKGYKMPCIRKQVAPIVIIRRG